MAAARGIVVLGGRCHEDRGAPPYWPWVQILRRFAKCQDDHALRAALGSGASDITEICPELRDRLPGLAAPQPLADAGQARFRLFDAVSEFWKRAAAVQPLLLIFEDLHWADVPSMRLFEFVAGENAGCRVLFIGTSWRVPEGIRAFIGARLNLLSSTAKRLLQHGAIIGTRFSFRLLRRLVEDLSEDQVVTALDEALANHIIEDLNELGCYQFAQVLTRDTLHQEMPSLEPARLHQGIGTALEDHQQQPRTSSVAVGASFQRRSAGRFGR